MFHPFIFAFVVQSYPRYKNQEFTVLLVLPQYHAGKWDGKL
jgi:hypothetical protein